MQRLFAGAGTRRVHLLRPRAGEEAGMLGLPFRFASGLAVQMNDRAEATRDGEQVALELAWDAGKLPARIQGLHDRPRDMLAATCFRDDVTDEDLDTGRAGALAQAAADPFAGVDDPDCCPGV